MKNCVFLVVFIGCLLFANPSMAQGELSIEEAYSIEMIPIGVYGKAGAIFNSDGSYKLCPGCALYRCATIEISLKDIWNLIFSPVPTGGDTPVSVEIYDEQQQVINRIVMKMSVPFPEKFHSGSDIRTLTFDDIILK